MVTILQDVIQLDEKQIPILYKIADESFQKRKQQAHERSFTTYLETEIQETLP